MKRDSNGPPPDPGQLNERRDPPMSLMASSRVSERGFALTGEAMPRPALNSVSGALILDACEYQK
jgi:hypothetical protein